MGCWVYVEMVVWVKILSRCLLIRPTHAFCAPARVSESWRIFVLRCCVTCCGYVREHGPGVVVQECLKRFSLGLSLLT